MSWFQPDLVVAGVFVQALHTVNEYCTINVFNNFCVHAQPRSTQNRPWVSQH